MSRKRLISPLFVFSILQLASLHISAQSLERIEKQAIRSFDRENFVKARDQFQILYDSGFNQVSTSTYLASCFLELNEPSKAYEVLSSVKTEEASVTYLKILSSFYLEKFNEAERLIQSFDDSTEFDLESVVKQLSNARFSYDNEKGYLIQNFGSSVNSKDMEYSAVMFDDYNKLLYTVRKENNEVTDGSGLTFETVYSTQIDSTDTWEAPSPLEIKVQDKRSHDATVQIYDSGNKMISYHDGRLYISTLSDGVLVEEEFFDLHGDDDAIDTHCFLTEDQNTLFFASDYLSEGLNLDLFVTNRDENGEWSDPEPIEVFNTEFDEDSPFLASDGTFYFSSRGHNSMGGYDIFKSTYDSINNVWGTPENMGTPINSVAEDIYYTTEGKVGYMSSTRLGGYGSLDLYRVFLFNKVKVRGKLLDDKGEPIAEAIIDIKYDSTNLRTYTDDMGDYEMFVPINTNIHTTFIKDSLNLFEGDYIINIFFKDQNDNEFNFYIDYLDEESQEAKEQEVEHINIEVKNDYTFNPIISSVDKQDEESWADSVNVAIREKELERREISLLKIESSNASIQSRNLNLKSLSIQRQNKTPATEEVSTEAVDDSGFVVQVLAMPIRKEPNKKFFKKLDSYVIDNLDGKDGLRRFFIGGYASRKEARDAMRTIRELGYSDAFVRKTSRYLEL